jgi:uncharacterized membrane protein YbhN (UPF0104 family)
LSTSSARHYIILALKISVSIALLTILFSRIDVARLWATARQASVAWLLVALLLYTVNVVLSLWRWHVLLVAQEVAVPARVLTGSYLVALFFNNFLPSNIGGDFFRIADTAKIAKSKTTATIVVLADRVMGVIALVFIAAIGATVSGAIHPAAIPIWPVWLWAGFFAGAAASAPAVLAPDRFSRLLRPLTIIHPEWVGGRLDNLTTILARFRRHPVRLIQCFLGAILVQATAVAFYYAVILALHEGIGFADLAVIVPISYVVQLLPISVSGFGVREATFSLYFARIGQPVEGAILMSLVGQALVMVFSLSGAAVYVSRTHQKQP